MSNKKTADQAQHAPQEPNQPVVWVTGSGAKRVGRTVAEHFAKQGYRVALHARSSLDQLRSSQDEIAKLGVRCITTTGDIRSYEAMEKAVEVIVREFGRLDAMIHCAAVWDWKALEETTEEDLRHQFEINTLGSYNVAKAAGLAMVGQSSGGRIVLVGDWAVIRPYRDFSAYFVGKGAIETLVRSMAVELASRNPNVHVNGILPGPVMLDQSVSHERAHKILQSSLVKRHGRPEDVAQAAHFLATQSFITGACLPVDGGRSIYAPNETESVAHPTFKSG
jgi:NAD(P)-dependent dehydrogenase (short-subunit alcohol dehydrogenase family)